MSLLQFGVFLCILKNSYNTKLCFMWALPSPSQYWNSSCYPLPVSPSSSSPSLFCPPPPPPLSLLPSSLLFSLSPCLPPPLLLPPFLPSILCSFFPSVLKYLFYYSSPLRPTNQIIAIKVTVGDMSPEKGACHIPHATGRGRA